MSVATTYCDACGERRAPGAAPHSRGARTGDGRGARARRAAPRARSAPEQIQVYLDELTPPGRFGLDLHANYAARARATPEDERERPPDRVYRLTPEFYYGLSRSFELGLYGLSAIDRGHEWHVDGAKLRLKYVAPHDRDAGAFVGLNLGVGKSDLAVAARPWNDDLKGIAGERFGRWLLAVNLDVDCALSSHGGPARIALDARLAYGASRGLKLALEAYDELGPLTGPGDLHGRSQLLYAVVDADLRAFDLDFGVGRGLTAAADGWVLKAIVGFHF